ncbi:DUF3244 domain-containing protein [Phocaeicola sp.]
MAKKTILIFILLISFLGTSWADTQVSTRTILLRSTRSEKILKRPRSILNVPVEATYDQSFISLHFNSPLKEVVISIFNESTGEVVYENSIYISDSTTFSIGISGFEEGDYTLQIECEEDIYCGTFNN